MDLEDLARAGAVIGAAGAALVLLGTGRRTLLPAFALLGVAVGFLASYLVPGADLHPLVSSPARIALVCLLGLAVLAGGALLARRAALVPVLLLAAAPFRVPVSIGAQEAFLLLPLYAILAAGVVALCLRLLRPGEAPPLPRVLAVPVATFVGFAGLSVLWTDDPRAGAIRLLFFLFPFAALVAVVARAPFPRWLPSALGATFVAIACGLAGVGLSQLWTEHLYFARDLEVANAYTSYFRTTSVFADSSIYGRQLALAITVLLAALWLARFALLPGIALVALLWTALFFTYSQSSMVALAAATLGLALAAAGRLGRFALLGLAVVIVAATAAVLAVSGREQSFDRITSGRSGLVESTWGVFVDHPVVGVGIGAQPAASQEAGGRRRAEKNVSHTTPLTVAAELGALGVLAYAGLLAGAGILLAAVTRVDRPLGFCLAACLGLLIVHSLFYAGFFEDPLTWEILGLGAAALAARGAVAAPAAAGNRSALLPASRTLTGSRLRRPWHT